MQATTKAIWAQDWWRPLQFLHGLSPRPAEKFWVVTPQTSLKFLGQNLFGDQFWGQSEAGKVWPQAILGPGAMGLTGGLPLDLK